jgi:hypothetical protein
VEEKSVEDALAKVWSAVQVLAFPRLRATVCAVPPLYEPENVRVPLAAVRLARLEPSATPLMVELVRPALLRVPVQVGVMVSAPFVAAIVVAYEDGPADVFDLDAAQLKAAWREFCGRLGVYKMRYGSDVK